MGLFSDKYKHEVCLEFLRPSQIEKILKTSPYIYIPFGAIEWHCYHNPVGLDTIKAHEQLIALASKTGGAVYPPVYFGSGGGHTDWPYSIMFSKENLVNLTCELIFSLENIGFKKAILLSGHYPNKHEYLDEAVDNYKKDGGRMNILSLIENSVEGVTGDHAGCLETSYLMYLSPDSIEMKELEGFEDKRIIKEHNNYMDEEFKNHPCYGIVGIDPRVSASKEIGKENTDNLLEFLEKWVVG